jgi:isoleucyl-tRNA synthetase
MLGEKVERRFGWDCHGLPAEMEAEKELKVGGQVQIKEYGIDKFNEHCRKSVLRYTNEWREYVTRQARWVDFDNDYKTMDTAYMESVIWAFGQLYEKGLLYEDTRVVPYSWKCQTPLSNFETHLDNSYRIKQSKSVYVKFELEEVPTQVLEIYPHAKKVYMVVWTTTPWTLPSNLALAVGDDIDYAIIEDTEKTDEFYIVAQDRVEHLKLGFLNSKISSKKENYSTEID